MYLTGVICTRGFPRVGVPLQEPWLCPGPSLSPGTAFAPPPRPSRAVWGPRGWTEGEEARGPPCRLRPLEPQGAATPTAADPGLTFQVGFCQ